MTTTQNDRNSMSDGQLDAVSAGSGYVKIGDVRAPRGAKRLLGARRRADMYAGMTYTDRGTQPYIKRRLGSDDELW